MKAEALAPLIATGATPGVDCLLMSTDGASFLRNSSIEAGVCALRNWDEYELELANVTEQNAALLAAAENASAVTVCEEEEEEVYEATYPAWRTFALPGLWLLQVALIFVGDLLSRYAPGEKKNERRVTPVEVRPPSFLSGGGALLAAARASNRISGVIGRGSGTSAAGDRDEDLAAVAPEPGDLASVTPVGGDAPPPPPASPRLADSLTFVGLFGFTGVFVAIAMVALSILAMYLAFKAENEAIPASQVLCFYAIALLVLTYCFGSVVYWRSMVMGLVEIIKGEVDPLSALDKVPTLKKLMKWYNDNLAIHTAGRFSILVIIAAEVFEFLVQAYNADQLARFLHWDSLSMYCDLISINFMETAANKVFARRDFVSRQFWKTFIEEDGEETLVYVSLPVEHPEAPKDAGVVRADGYAGYVFRRDAGSTVTRATMLVCVDPRGSVPLNVVNFVTTGSLVKKLKSFQRFFVERKAKDGSDNNGVWPAGDEADYAFTSELGGGERRASLGAVKLLTDRIERLQTKGVDGAEVVPGTSRCRFDISARTMNDVRVYFRTGFFGGGVCGFGVDRNPNRDTWKFDARGCGMEVFGGEWYDAFTDLEVLDLSDNELVELPLWLGQGKMLKLKELRARGNKVGAFVGGMLGEGNTTLVEVDLRDNEIAELPYELMDAESENTTLLFDGNPCAEEVDWSGLGVDRLPARMVGEGYENGDFHNSLKVLKMGRNRFDERVVGELVAANFTNIKELDVSWNALGGIEKEEVRGLKKLRRLDVSGNKGIGVGDLSAAPEDLEMLNASFCGVDDITGEDAIKLQDHNMLLHGNDVVKVHWAYNYDLRVIPTWLRTLEKVTYANLQYSAIKEIKGGVGSLAHLTASGNRLITLEAGLFNNTRNLIYLSVSGNRLTTLEAGLFDHTRHIQVVYLRDNQIESLPPGMFRGVGAAELDLSTNALTSLPADVFEGMDSLWKLILGDNKIEELPAGVFQGLGSLEHLTLDGNELTTMPTGVFDGLAALNYISLDDNPFEELPPNLFSGLCRLDGLYLDGTISPEVFADSTTFGGKTLCGALRGEFSGGASNAIETLDACEEQADDDACAYCGVPQSSCIAIGSAGGEACSMCGLGKFSEVVGSVSADDCAECEEGKVSSVGSAACVTVTGCVWSIFIGNFRDFINLSEVQAFDASGALIQPFGAEMYSTHLPAENCIDGNVEFQPNVGCHSSESGPYGPLEYLRVDYAGDVAALRSIVVTNRNDHTGEVSNQRIVGSVVHVGPGQPTALANAAAAALWTAAFETSQATYSFETPALSCPAQG
ncbi:hypothetical protein TeGR_g13771 [Tetraparma gracilis]|uniref:START domain-containing protein n=1 Tax=Tetraparma gracilis TaxID=2962635 RepID=A0ABQ6NBF3_9STRA|nr:hypothetical protein TeGR_g13771 [Tetraparma gracilis]